MKCMLIGLPETEFEQERVARWLTHVGLEPMAEGWAVPPDDASEDDVGLMQTAVDLLAPEVVLCIGQAAYELAQEAGLTCPTLFAPWPGRTRQSDAQVVQKLARQLEFYMQSGASRLALAQR